ncbi:MerR HTH family regulatory protein [Humidesulfovibrio mexicanus]|uniref:MerR HTH family regulatory protein n=1 Tax=Humidesulfovibrio mexicanus TaxID=147047 RepID=A0A239C2Y0_9BACT|nr:MerR family transcriptional regulator [Humidesulfovibrio mexicanus]SNS14018.1 MerR HTH family regulatory protein [Humidesulfovibrio mexicanus]
MPPHTSYTHRDLAQALGVSETTIKSYRAKFPAFLPVARLGKPVRLHPESLDICRRIRDLFADGMSIAQATAALRTEFKEFPQNRRLSTAKGFAPRPPVLPPETEDGQTLSARLDALAQAQDQTRLRMEQLERELRNLATLEAASKSLVAELVEEFRAARRDAGRQAAQGPVPLAAAQGTPGQRQQDAPSPSPSPGDSAATGPAANSGAEADLPPGGRPGAKPVSTPGEHHGPPAEHAAEAKSPAQDQDGPTVLTARKIVTLHGPAGPVASYSLGREPSPPPPFPEPEAPPAAFLDLPAVIRSGRGDFLGLPGGQSVRRLVHVLRPEGGPAPAWIQEGPDAWTCAIPLGRAQTREMLFERTTTPRGNLVGHIRRMRINEVEATPEQLQEIFRQLRDQLT